MPLECPLDFGRVIFFCFSAGLILPHPVFVGPVDRPLVMQGRTLRPEDVALIRDWLQAHPDSNRTRLSRDLCVAWNWRNGAGRLKDMACRTLLLKLEARGQIQLPPRRSASVNGLRNRAVPNLEHDPTTITGSLELLQPVQVQPVAPGRSEALLFQLFLQRYHYLGHRNCVGHYAQLPIMRRWSSN